MVMHMEIYNRRATGIGAIGTRSRSRFRAERTVC